MSFLRKRDGERTLFDRRSCVLWLPQDVKAPLFLNSITIEEAGGLLLCDPYKPFGPYTLTARICRSCGKGVFDLSLINHQDEP